MIMCIYIFVFFSAEGAKNVSWTWLSPFCGWGSLTMAFTGKFIHAHSLTKCNFGQFRKPIPYITFTFSNNHSECLMKCSCGHT